MLNSTPIGQEIAAMPDFAPDYDRSGNENSPFFGLRHPAAWAYVREVWPAPGFEDTELGVLMELEVGHGETEVYTRV
jgi:hypothetical protein